MGIQQGLTTSFKVEILKGLHDFTATTGHTFKLALYSSDADLGPSTTAYSTTNEASGTGYTAGGATLTSVTPTSSSTIAICDFADVTWASSTITARGGLIYNSTQSNRAVAVISFGTDRYSSGTDFVVTFPTPDQFNAIIRIS